MDDDVNYIVSGLERSGTSMLMQVLHAGGVPVSFDEKRPSDRSNPREYFELEGGKIINRLIEGTFPLERYGGRFIKVTSYGIGFLPEGQYRIIYSLRNIDEIMNSMDKMTGGKDEDREGTRRAFDHLNRTTMERIRDRDDMEIVYANYNEMIQSPQGPLRRIVRFLDISDRVIPEMMKVIDKNLYKSVDGSSVHLCQVR